MRSYECGPDGRVLFSHICNYLQETASVHAQKLGFSKTNFEPLGLTWVLTRMRVRLDAYPAWGEDVVVLTYPRGMRKLTAYRDFALSRPDGTPLGPRRQSWKCAQREDRRASRGEKPNFCRYIAENRPKWVKPHFKATSVTEPSCAMKD